MNVSEVGNRAGRHAIVIGAGVAGLVAARVLSDHFVRVTLMDRDSLPDAPMPRSWVPQGQHAHVLAHSGQVTLERLFPGLFAGMGANGSVAVDLGAQMHWQHLGIVSTRARTGALSQFQSRYALEWHMRRQLRALDNICILQRAQVTGLRTNCTGEAISGVEFCTLSEGDAQKGVLTADLVVDASGRMSQLPRWLQVLGYDCAGQSEIAIDFTYASRIYRRPRSFRGDWKVLLCEQDPAAGSRSVRIVPIEDDCWIVTAGGRLGERPPGDEAGFLDFLQSVLDPETLNALRGAEALSPILSGRLTSNQRRYYERLKRFPGRLIALGDALCSLNPFYGQGMGMCIEQAVGLDRCIRRSGGELTRAARRFRSDSARMVDAQWMVAACEELRYAQARSSRPAVVKAFNWHMRKLRGLSAHDAEAMHALLAVAHMHAHPKTLYRPGMILKVLASSLRRRRSPALIARRTANSAVT